MTAHAVIKNTFFEDFFVQKCLTIIAGDGSNQKQEMVIEDSGKHENEQSTIEQIQKAGKNSKQVQVGKINDGKQ